MQGKALEWLVGLLLKNLDAAVAAKALVSLLRAAVLALKDVALKTPSSVDDTVIAKLGEIVEDIAKGLKVA